MSCSLKSLSKRKIPRQGNLMINGAAKEKWFGKVKRLVKWSNKVNRNSDTERTEPTRKPTLCREL